MLDDPLTFTRDLNKGTSRTSLELPPLHVPIAAQLLSRPSPLEPNASANGEAHKNASQLTAGPEPSQKTPQKSTPVREHPDAKRGKGDGAGPPERRPALSKEAPATRSRRRTAKGPVGIPLDDIWSEDDEAEAQSSYRGPKKRQKLGLNDGNKRKEFVQLPRPAQKKARTSTTIPALAVLSGLSQPPPNAALFPPISTEAFGDSPGAAPQHEDSSMGQSLADFEQSSDATGAPPKTRTYSGRARKKWDRSETDCLVRGVAQHGIGSWKRILKDPAYKFNARSAIDLKDR